MRKKKTETIVYNDYDKYLDADLIALVKNKLGADSDAVLNEMTDIIKLESNMPPMLDKGKTYGDWNLPALSMYYTGDYRPSDALPLDVINQMLKSSPVRFALEMKRAQVVSVFRNSRSWDIVSPDTELAEVVKANLQTILPKMSLDFSFSSMAYGASFQELVWEYKSKYELGISEDDIEDTDAKPTDNNKANELEDKVGSDKKFIVAKIPNSINPATIVRINRKKDGSFDGFVQQAKTFNAQEVVVPREASLVIPYEEKFRNLWGESLLKPMYPIWFWYEVVLRAMVKYMERTGTPVALVRAPSRATIIKPGTKTKVDGITWGMEIASNVARSNAAVIPSDTDDSGKPLWDLSYLNSTERSQPFLDILELLTQMILRAGLSADRALSQSSGGTGSYAIGKVHQEATSLHNEMVLIQWVHYLNTYFLPLYSLYNRGQNGPPIWMETQGLDPMDRENLVALLGIAQGMPAFQEVGYKIDWEAIFATNNIPMKSQSEADAIKKKQEEENLAKQEAMLSTQAKFNTPSPTKQADGTLKANMPNKPAEDKKSDANVKAEEQSESFLDSENIELMNPNHGKDGRFTSGKSVAGGIYQEGNDDTFSSNGDNYNINKIFEIADKKPVKNVKVSDLTKNHNPDVLDKNRIDSADINTPIIVFDDPKYGMVIADGAHRLEKAIQLGRTTIKSKIISYDELQKTKLDSSQEEVIQLFNPFHSKSDGRFTSGKAGIGGGMVHPNKNKIAEQPKEFNIGGLLVKTALVGGGLAAGGLMVSSLIAQANENEQMQKRLDLMEKGFTPDQINQLMEVGYHSYAVMKNPDGTYSTTVFLDDGTMMDSGKSSETNSAFSKSFDDLASKNKEELADLINQANIDIDNLSDDQIIALSRNGLLERIKSLDSGKISIMRGDYQFADIPKFNNKADVDKFLTDRYAALGVELDTSKIQFSTDKEGLWGNITRDAFNNPNGRIVNIEETWFNKLFGNGQGEKVFVTHALAHEYGHSLQGFGQGNDGNIVRPTDNDDLYRIEGGAEVYARLALAPYKVNAGPDYKEYTTSTGVAAGLMDAYIKQNNSDLPSALKSYNSNIASNIQHYQYLKDLFPNRMANKTTLPSQATIQRWLEQDYDVTTEQSMDELMQMALSMNGNN